MTGNLSSHKQERAHEIGSKSLQTTRASSQLMFGLAALMACVGIAVSWLLSRRIRQALGAEPDALSVAVAWISSGRIEIFSIRPSNRGVERLGRS